MACRIFALASPVSLALALLLGLGCRQAELFFASRRPAPAFSRRWDVQDRHLRRYSLGPGERARSADAQADGPNRGDGKNQTW